MKSWEITDCHHEPNQTQMQLEETKTNSPLGFSWMVWTLASEDNPFKEAPVMHINKWV